nr:methyltransferase domain-containing protein [Fundidesulfovibrio agrisoli]
MKLSTQQRERIAATLDEKYRSVASAPEGQFQYPTGQAGLDGLGYEPGWYAHIPGEVRRFFCGVGNPFKAGLPAPGQSVLDVGCGAGVDTLVAAALVGPEGLACGVERSFPMLERACRNREACGFVEAQFVSSVAEALPFADGSFDMVISSGVYNLVVDKREALQEAYRVLKPGGRLQVADQMLVGPPPMSEEEAALSWFR